MYDRIEKLGRSTIQHGPLSRRVYLMKLSLEDMPEIITTLDTMARTKEYTKIFVKIPATLEGDFIERGYRQEARVPRLYEGACDGLFMGKYFEDSRLCDPRTPRMWEILEIALERKEQGLKDGTNEPPCIETASPADASEMSAVYREVFPSYPFPIHDPEYLRETMRDHVRYFCIRHMDRIVSLASADFDSEARNVEMTDFATLPSHRGAGHAVQLLGRMGDEMLQEGMATAYTIARSMSPGMNVTFAKMGYKFAGTLANNTNISGTIESMNVWYKHL